jgi:hypothetical protein
MQMDALHQTVTNLPLARLWCSTGPLDLHRVQTIGKERIAELLRTGTILFVVADVGLPLRWIDAEDTFRFWKSEVSTRLVEPDRLETGFHLEDYPDGYCYLASQWTSHKGNSVILLEKNH